ncbi:hypothetical protein E3N88_28802 [Mikania micrantha]|uniref:Uncharacterized protein n=1 Tax=Mikania micrantha TaxID=192012 RepID=A0A5N6N127_9ASTR|nr:hypothetical protein E3N88_28802 [Mikania micrantha]
MLKTVEINHLSLKFGTKTGLLNVGIGLEVSFEQLHILKATPVLANFMMEIKTRKNVITAQANGTYVLTNFDQQLNIKFKPNIWVSEEDTRLFKELMNEKGVWVNIRGDFSVLLKLSHYLIVPRKHKNLHLNCQALAINVSNPGIDAELRNFWTENQPYDEDDGSDDDDAADEDGEDAAEEVRALLIRVRRVAGGDFEAVGDVNIIASVEWDGVVVMTWKCGQVEVCSDRVSLYTAVALLGQRLPSPRWGVAGTPPPCPTVPARGMDVFIWLLSAMAQENASQIPRPIIRRIQINRDRETGHDLLMRHYFGNEPLYNETLFKRRFRMQRPLFERIVNDLEGADTYFQLRWDARGKQGFTPLQKCTSAIRQLAYGSTADIIDDYLQMSDNTSRECLYNFYKNIRRLYGPKYSRKPNYNDVMNLYEHHENYHGFPGMLGSIDCMHWDWENCPVAWRGQFMRGDHGCPSIILEAVASHDLWIWHAYFGMPVRSWLLSC